MAIGLEAGEGFISILPDLNQSKFSAALSAKVGPALSTVGSRVKGAVTKLSQAIGAPLAAGVGVGLVASIGSITIGFENAFTKIAALSNASAQDIANWREQVISLSGATARSPQELADALFFLSSAGLKTSEVMPALEAAAKGAAVGLGSTADVANIAASALNAYANSGLTAADVTDTLVAAVREGRAEPDAFAEAMGRVLPIASRAGVEFDQVAASLAGLSNIGLDVNEGVTALRGLLQSLVAPGSQAAKALASMGISTDQLRAVLADQGLLGALNLLEDATGGNIDQLRVLVPNIRALTGELGLTGENAAKVADTFHNVANATGSLDKAFKITTQSVGFQFQALLATLQRLALQVGEAVLPAVTQVVGALKLVAGPLGAILGVVADLSPALVTLGEAFLAFKLVTFLPNLLVNIGAGLQSMNLVRSGAAVGNLGLAFSGVATSLGIVAAAAVPLVFAWNAIRNAEQKVNAQTKALTDQILGSKGSLDALRESLGLNTEQFKTWIAEQAFGISGDEAGSRAWDAYAADVGNSLQSILTSQTGVKASTIEINTVTGAIALTAARAQTAFDLYGKSLLESTNLTNANKLSLATLLNTFEQFGGALSEDKQLWLNDAIAAGKFNEVQGFLQDQLDKTSLALKAMADSGDVSAKRLLSLKTASEGLATAVGTDLAGLSAAGQKAFVTDGNKYGAAWDEFVAGVIDKTNELRVSMAESIGGVSDVLGTLVDKAHLTVDGVSQAFQQAARDARDFGRDLSTIARDSEVGKALAQQLLEFGPQAAGLADFIAGATGKARDRMISDFGKLVGAGQKAGNDLATAIGVPLQHIAEILKRLVSNEHPIQVVLVDEATARLNALVAYLKRIQQTTYTVNIQTIQGGDAPLPPPPDGPPGKHARGGITRGATWVGRHDIIGEARTPTPFGRGAEWLAPLTDDTFRRLGEQIVAAMGAGKGGNSPDIVIHHTTKLDEKVLGESVTRYQQRGRMVRGG